MWVAWLPEYLPCYTSYLWIRITKDILETINFIKDNMVTKTDFNEGVEKLNDRLTAVESKVGAIHNRIDDETLKRANLEKRVHSAVSNLPPPPERV